MKKKILAILLCFTLIIPFALTSCYGNNWLGDIDGGDKLSFYDSIKDSYKKIESASAAASFTIDGEYQSSSEEFLLAMKNESTETHAVAKYTVYDIKTGNEIVSVKLEREYKTGSFSSLYKEVSAAYGNGLFVIAGTKASGMIDYTVYNKNGKEILKGTNISYKLLGDKGILFDKKLYSVDSNGNATLVKDLTDSKLVSILDRLEKYGDRYLYVSGTVAYVFDSSYNLLYKQILNSTPSNTYLNTAGSMFYLNNGNIIYQENTLVCQYNPSINHNEYDYILGGSCYKVNTYLFDITNGTYKKINLPYLINSVSRASDYGHPLQYGYENVVSANKIDNNEIVYTNGSIYAYLFMDNSGSYVESNVSNITILGENRYATYDGFTYYIYNESDNLVGTLNSINFVNNELIVTPSAVYNHSLEVVCALDESTYVFDVLPNSVLIYFYDTESDSYQFKLVFSDKSSFIIDEYESVDTINSCVLVERMVTDENGEESCVLTIYSEKGEVLLTNALKADSYIYSEYDGIIRATSDDGKILIITIK